MLIKLDGVYINRPFFYAINSIYDKSLFALKIIICSRLFIGDYQSILVAVYVFVYITATYDFYYS